MSTLMRLAQRSTPAVERCELCGAPIAADHRHVLELATRDVKCACRPCGLLFERTEKLRLIGTEVFAADEVELPWEELRLPVDIAFFVRSTAAERMQSFYPGPMGATESLLTFAAWTALEDANPVMRTLQPDVEALLADRARGRRRHWIVPIDDCFALVGQIRTQWRGVTGGGAVWDGIARFFDDLDRRAAPAREEMTWQT